MLQLTIETIEGDKKMDFEVKKILSAGYTARNQSQVQKHIDELAKEGIPSPSFIPFFFPKMSDRITTSDKIEVLADNTTSGEVEFVLLFDQDKLYVSVGSDHTDRKLERYDVLASKQICFHVLSEKIWPYVEVKNQWDNLLLRSWVERDGEWQLYQEARLGAFMKVDEIIEKAKGYVIGDLDGMVFYAGTIPVIGGELCFSRRFKMELIDEKMGRSLKCAYTTVPINWFLG